VSARTAARRSGAISDTLLGCASAAMDPFRPTALQYHALYYCNVNIKTQKNKTKTKQKRSNKTKQTHEHD
jgi:hypothetical protein